MGEEIRNAGTGKKYDCIVGFSGGCDSSYLLHVTKNIMHCRPLAVHFNNTWDTEISKQNINNVTKALNVDLYEYACHNDEYDDIYMSFFKAGVADIEAPTDIALAATLQHVAEKYKIKYILEGHNFRTEGISPIGWLYMDWKYVTSVHKLYGSKKIKSYPSMSLWDMVRWMAIRGIKKYRPLWYMDYNKEDVKKFLADNYGWKWYGGHHLENKFTAFYHSYFMPKRYKIDTRTLGYSAQVRTGKMERKDALELLRQPFVLEDNLIDYILDRFKITKEDLDKFINQPNKTYKDYPNYKQTFIRLRPFFWIMTKLGRIPLSFYIKYTH
jgi:hypothetical protein